MNNGTSYTRRDVNSILDYLKEQAEKLSEGRWTDFSAGDIGSVFLGLMAYLADVNNFQIDKTASELFLDTAVERSSIMSLLKLIGYKPRHYQSAYVLVQIEAEVEGDPTSNTLVIPRLTTFTNAEASITYTTLMPYTVQNGKCTAIAYEGVAVTKTYTYSDITSEGRIYLDDYKIGTNTLQVLIPGVSTTYLDQVDDVRFTDGSFCYSCHVDEYAKVYLQLPSFWSDLLTEQSSITVSYLVTNGESGRVGANILKYAGYSTVSLASFTINNPQPSYGGYYPESTDELKVNAPRHARTMDTIVTKKDMEDLVICIPEVAYIKCGDYNDDWTGYVQPQDAYKCKVLAVPSNTSELSLYETDEDGNKKPTSTLERIMSYVDERRLASIMMFYEDPKRLVPNIELNIYLDPNDLKVTSIASEVITFMKAIYNRSYLHVGESLHGSVIGKDILNAFPSITYIEVQAPEYKITVAEDEYIDMYYARFKVYVNDTIVLDEWED